MVGIGLTDLPKIGAPLVPSVPPSLQIKLIHTVSISIKYHEHYRKNKDLVVIFIPVQCSYLIPRKKLQNLQKTLNFNFLKWIFLIKKRKCHGSMISFLIEILRFLFIFPPKGQLISEANFKVFIWTKNRTKIFLQFCPSL